MKQLNFLEYPDPQWLAWFVGLVDGEGCFYIAYHKNSFSMVLKIDLREDDKVILEEIQNKIGGYLDFYDACKRRLQGMNMSNTWRWRIQKKDNLMNFILPIFDQYPLKTKKQKDYIIWRKAVLLFYRTRRSLLRDEQLLIYKKELEVGRRNPITIKNYNLIPANIIEIYNKNG